ncbi:hypothetical protein HETIRDRAFT_435112 [Heterobasidion irregulare TC 32-1]|uniref:Pentacotripeptide-repeat region of PRORP domain-containing protein n=1 Tax=Heterobasidion irregulare (strain TC 32-1) TaxID=747525 RepID=W4K421_HETIT|nr:uncharacterized protein HETIRDRAFT_435112 [Heterobasidion irregulare TC 32-1]ETW79781.1 hypothetical protein HETIRDRAFT_435112 [Heterobasidion irregulare TC 32-1]
MQTFVRLWGTSKARNARFLATATPSPALLESDARLYWSLRRTLRVLAQTIRRRSRDPVWNVVDLRGSHLQRVKALQASGISVATHRQWSQALHEGSEASNTSGPANEFNDTIARLNLKLIDDVQFKDTLEFASSAQPAIIKNDQPPTYFILYILFHLTRTPAQAHRALSLVIGHLPYATPENRPLLLLVTAHILAAHRDLPALDHLVSIFLALPLFSTSWHFNLLLQGIARYAVSPDSGRTMGGLAVKILQVMRSRELSVLSDTYTILLRNRYITTELATTLNELMIAQGFSPNIKHLELYAHVFARRSAIRLSDTYLRTVRSMIGEKEEQDSDAYPKTPNTATYRYRLNLIRSNSKVIQRNGRPPLPEDPAEWAAQFYARAQDKSIPGTNLVEYFAWCKKKVPFLRPATNVTYSILMSALLLRRDYELAKEVWDDYRASGLQLDRRALGVGLEVLTRAGDLQEAFDLLEKSYWRSKTIQPTFWPHRNILTKGAIDIVTINSFMKSLLIVGRPDLVYMLWENMGTLYSTKPDSETLRMLLDAARMASRSFESLSGALRELGFRNPFHRNTPPHEGPSSMTEARLLILAQLRDAANDHVKPTNFWGDVVAWRRACSIFRDIILSNWPELVHVQSPAQALRTSSDDIASSPMVEIKRTLFPPHPSHFQHASVHIIPEHAVLHKGLYPSVAYSSVDPSERAFVSYIALLVSQSLASDIPLALAWMRALDVHPSRSTIALALVSWREVSASAPLLETWSRGSSSSEYTKLVDWVLDWVGEENMPSNEAIGKAVRRVSFLRRGSVSW